jgi:hypothetical protein
MKHCSVNLLKTLPEEPRPIGDRAGHHTTVNEVKPSREGPRRLKVINHENYIGWNGRRLNGAEVNTVDLVG